MTLTHEIVGTVTQYNLYRFEQLLEQYSISQQRAISLLPLLFHANIPMLPGYNGVDVPAGIEEYAPDEESLKIAGHLYSNFSHTSENQPQASISSVLIQSCFITGEKILWIIYKSNLTREDVEKLNYKTSMITKWLSRQGVRLKYLLSRADEIAYNYYAKYDYQYHIDKSFFLDRFYAESILLAGLQSSWWFEECADFSDVDVLNFTVDCGDLTEPGSKDYISASIWSLYNITSKPISSYIDLCLIDYFVNAQQHSFFSSRLKYCVLTAEKMSEIDVTDMYFDFLNEIIGEDLKGRFHIIKAIAKDSCARIHKNIYIHNFMFENRNIDFRTLKETLDDVFFHAISLFRRIKENLNLRGYTYSKLSVDLDSISCGLLSRLQYHEHKINVMYGVGVAVCDRVNYSQKHCGEKLAWVLAHNDYMLYAGSSLVGLSCWAYINQLIDHNTQVSITACDYSVRQIDVLEIIDVLENSIDLNDLYNVDINGFIDEPVVLTSLLVIGHHVKNYEKKKLDHLVIYNTGEVFLYQYESFNDIFDWHRKNEEEEIEVAIYGRYAGMFREKDRRFLSLLD